MLLVPPPWLFDNTGEEERKGEDIVTENGGGQRIISREREQVEKTVTAMKW